MTEVAIRADGLSKSYQIDHESRARYRTLRESLSSAVGAGFRRSSSREHETLWALRDVSFEVKRGEALGIIGRNGAGKSTLLRILSRITSPTSGRAEVYGRLGSLLEVGTGFHPELTGRENIFLNGAILGMRRREIAARFDEIVAFAETEKFLDTPVKHYSSGMYMRLAFAVAAHLETEILVVDEVLAVGDAAFQAKCLGKMEDVAGEGRTVLFVSHSVTAVRRLCSVAVLLDQGTVLRYGRTDDVLSHYSESSAGATSADLSSSARGSGKAAHFLWAELRNRQNLVSNEFGMGDPFSIQFRVRLPPGRVPKFAIFVRASDGTAIAQIVDDDSRFLVGADGGEISVTVGFDDLRLFPDSYFVSLWVEDRATQTPWDHARDCLVFRIVDGGHVTSRYLSRSDGIVFLSPHWGYQESAPPVTTVV